MSDPEPTFSVEVLGFPPGADPDTLAESVSGFFGISKEEGRRLVLKAPIRVKRNAPPDVAQQLVRQLRKLGADVLVRNEATGEERSYRIEAPPASHKLVTAPIDPVVREITAPVIKDPDAPPPEDTLPSEDDPAPAENPPNIEVILANGEPVPAALPPISDRQGGLPESNRRGTFPSDPVEPPRSGKPISGSGGRAVISVPPPSIPPPAASSQPGAQPSVPPPSAPKLDYCASCKSPIDKGDTCSRCGWSNARKERHCRQCKAKLSIVSSVTGKAWITALVLVGALLAGAAGFLLLGPLFAAGLMALAAAAAFMADGSTLRYACKSCTVAVYSGRLQKEEEERLRAARRKSITGAALCALIMGGFLAFTTFSGRTLSGSSYGIAWQVVVPATHSELGNEVRTVKLPVGPKAVRVQYAARPYLGGSTYYLAHIQYTHPARPAESDREGLETALKQLVEAVYNGTPGALQASGDSREVSFTGTFHGKQVFGRLRGAQHEHDMLFLAVTSGSQADLQGSGVDRYLAGLKIERDAK